MNFGIASLSKADLGKLSQEVAKLGGGVNIRTLKPAIFSTTRFKASETAKINWTAVEHVGEFAQHFLDIEQGPVKNYLLAGFNLNLLVCNNELFSLEFPEFIKQVSNQIWEHSSYKLALSICECFVLEDSHNEQFMDLLNQHEKPTGKLKNAKYFEVKDEKDITLLFESAQELYTKTVGTMQNYSATICKLVLQKGEKNDFYSELTFLNVPTKFKKNERFYAYISKLCHQLEDTLLQAQKQSPINKFIEEKRENTKKLSLTRLITKIILRNCVNWIYFEPSEEDLAINLTKNLASVEVIAFKNQPNQPNEVFPMKVELPHPLDSTPSREASTISKQNNKEKSHSHHQQQPDKNFAMTPSQHLSKDTSIDEHDVKAFEFKRKYNKYNLEITEKENKPAEMNNASLHLLNLDFKQNYQKNKQLREEFTQQKESLESEIIELKAFYETQLEDYRKSVSELNTKLQLLVNKQPDLKRLLDEYEREIVRLEIQNKNLNERMQKFLITENSTEKQTSDKRLQKFKNLATILSADLADKERELQQFRKNERATKQTSLTFQNYEEMVTELKKENKSLNVRITDQQNTIEDINQIVEQLRLENKRLTNERNLEAIEKLSLKEENLIMKDILEGQQQQPQKGSKDISTRVIASVDVTKKEDLIALDRINREAMISGLKDLKEYVLKQIKLDKDTVIYKIEAQETVSHSFLNRLYSMSKKHQHSIDILASLQDRIEESLGKNHNLTRQMNKEIRSILSMQLVNDDTEQ